MGDLQSSPRGSARKNDQIHPVIQYGGEVREPTLRREHLDVAMPPLSQILSFHIYVTLSLRLSRCTEIAVISRVKGEDLLKWIGLP